MAKAKREKQQGKPVQPRLPGMPPPEPSGTIRVFPMQLKVGDKLSDESGEWEVVDRPYDGRRQEDRGASAARGEARRDGDADLGLLREDHCDAVMNPSGASDTVDPRGAKEK